MLVYRGPGTARPPLSGDPVDLVGGSGDLFPGTRTIVRDESDEIPGSREAPRNTAHVGPTHQFSQAPFENANQRDDRPARPGSGG